MTFDVTILGSSSATPAFQRNPASQAVHVNDRLFLVDCGEATQIQLTRFKIKPHRINHIFISHLHGDHYLGLMGLLSSMHLQGRSAELTIYCQEELKEILDMQFRVSATELRFPLQFHFLNNEYTQLLLDDEDLTVEAVKLNHRVPCMGFIFREKPKPRNIIKEKIQEYNIPVEVLPDIKKGKDFTDAKGKIHPNSELTTGSRTPRSFAYCSDTVYDERLIPAIKNIDLLYHEATFLHDLLPRAIETFHTTSLQAAQIAEKANVKKLIIGHFSARYKDLQPLLDEARSVFPNSFLALEGEKFVIE